MKKIKFHLCFTLTCPFSHGNTMCWFLWEINIPVPNPVPTAAITSEINFFKKKIQNSLFYNANFLSIQLFPMVQTIQKNNHSIFQYCLTLKFLQTSKMNAQKKKKNTQNLFKPWQVASKSFKIAVFPFGNSVAGKSSSAKSRQFSFG